MSWLFASGDQSIRWSFSNSPSSDYSGLISSKIDWFDILAVKGTLKNLNQHNSSKASILQLSAFFLVQLSHPYNYWKHCGFDYLDLCQQSDVFAFEYAVYVCPLSWSKCLLISWLQPPSAVIWEPKKRKSVTASTFSPSVFHEVMEQDAMILDFLMLSFKPSFSLSSFTFIKRLFGSSSLSAN